jgi:hypothetical protein
MLTLRSSSRGRHAKGDEDRNVSILFPLCKWLDEHPFAATTCPKCGHRWTELDEDDHGWIALDEQTADREARKYWTPSERAGLKALGFLYRASVGFPVRVMTVSMIRAFVQAARKVKEGK